MKSTDTRCSALIAVLLAGLLSACGGSAQSELRTAQETLDTGATEFANLPVGDECDGLTNNPWLEDGETAEFVGLLDVAGGRASWRLVEPAPASVKPSPRTSGSLLASVDYQFQDHQGETVLMPEVLLPYGRALEARLLRREARSLLYEAYAEGAGTGLIAIGDEQGNLEWLIECGGSIRAESAEIARLAAAQGITELDAVASFLIGGQHAINGWSLEDVRRMLEPEPVPDLPWIELDRTQRQVMLGDTPMEVLEPLAQLHLLIQIENAAILGLGNVTICVQSELGYSPCVGEPAGDDPAGQRIPFFAEPGERLEVWTLVNGGYWDRGALLGTFRVPVDAEIAGTPIDVPITIDLTGITPEQLGSDTLDVVTTRPR